MTFWILSLISAALLAGSIHPRANRNAALAQALDFHKPNVETGSPLTLEELYEKLRPRPTKNEILIKKDGQIVLNGSPLTMEDLPERLRLAKAADPSFRVIVRGDVGDLYHETIAVHDIVYRAGVGVATGPLRTRNMIVIKKNGRVILNGTPLPVEELRDKLRKAKEEDPSYRAGIYAETDLPPLDISNLSNVLDIMNELDVVSGLATGQINK